MDQASLLSAANLFLTQISLGGGGQNDMFAPPPNIFMGGEYPPAPPGSTPLLPICFLPNNDHDHMKDINV